MKNVVIAAAMSLCLVFLAAAASADTLVLKDGRRVSGRLVSFAARVITFRGADGVSHRYATADVTAVEFLPAPSVRAVTARTSRSPRAPNRTSAPGNRSIRGPLAPANPSRRSSSGIGPTVPDRAVDVHSER